MTESLPPESREELIAGYVLGNLSSAEAEEFQRLLQEDPQLAQEVERLQEVLELMPYGLPQSSPSPALREAILQAAKATEKPNLLRFSNLSLLTKVVGGAAALIAIAFGIDNYRLRQEIKIAEAKLEQQQFANSVTIVMSSEALLANNWEGVGQLVTDHLQSINKKSNPVDFPATDPSSILEHFQPQVSFPGQGIQFVREGSKLLGGSFCKLAKTKGIRFTYDLGKGQLISLYQLEGLPQVSFPNSGSGQLYISQQEGPAMVIWQKERFLYALVAEFPAVDIRQLAFDVIDG